MSRNHRHIPVQTDELLEYAPHQLVIITSRMICAANSSGKEGVAADEHLLRAFQEADSSRGVSRGLDHFELKVPDMNLIQTTHRVLFPGFLYRIPLESVWLRQPERLAEIRVGHLQRVDFARVHIHRNIIFPGQCGHSIYVVEMCVSEHYAHRLQTFCIHE